MPSSQNKKFAIALLVLGIIGLIDASFLTWQHYAHRIPPCTAQGCETVLTSKYATIGPVPIALLGVGYYAIVTILAALLIEGQTKWAGWLRAIVSLGFVATLGLVYLQGWVIHAWCQYCLVSAIVTASLFAGTWWMGRVGVGMKPPTQLKSST